jgi:hypothetical protein
VQGGGASREGDQGAAPRGPRAMPRERAAGARTTAPGGRGCHARGGGGRRARATEPRHGSRGHAAGEPRPPRGRSGAAPPGPRPRRGVRAQGENRGRAGEERGGGEEERVREREGRGAHLGDPNSDDHRLQDLGDHGEREMGERKVVAREKSNERKRPGRGHAGEGTGARGTPDRAGLGWVGLGWAAPRVKTHDTLTRRSESKRETKIATR